MLTRSSIANSISISSKNLNSSINVSISNNLELSLDNITFQTSIILEPNKLKNVYVRFSPTELGNNTGNIKIENSQTSSTNINLSGSGVKLRLNYKTFNKQHLAFGSGNSQFSIQKFDLHNDLKNVESIKMYIQLECPSGGCNAWDVYSNIMVKDPDSSEWFEIGRYITPYGTDNKKLDRGFEIDVTDFKSQLKPTVMSSPDIRAGIALLIAALSANGTSEIQNFEQIDRGYENIVTRLKKLGASIDRI